MKIHLFFLLIILIFSCKQSYVEKNDSSSFSGKFKTNRDWWPNQLDLSVLRKNSNLSNPMGENFDYEKEFNKKPVDIS